MRFDEAATADPLRDHLVCYEIGHTVGLEHFNPPGGYTSCMRSDTNQFTNLNVHDIEHINGYY